MYRYTKTERPVLWSNFFDDLTKDLTKDLTEYFCNIEDIVSDIDGEVYKKTTGEKQYVPIWYYTDTDDKYQISVELPGVSKEQIDIVIKNGVLSIEGIKEKPEGYEGNNYGKFKLSRSVPGGRNVKAAAIDGILTIKVNKPKEVKIDIN